MRALLCVFLVGVAVADTAIPKTGTAGDISVDELILQAEGLASRVNQGKAPPAELEALLPQIVARGRFERAGLVAESAFVHSTPTDADRAAVRSTVMRLVASLKPAETWRRGVELWLALAWFAKAPRQVATAGSVVFDDLDSGADGPVVKRSHKENLGRLHSLYTDLAIGRTSLQGPPLRCDAKCCDFFDGNGAGDNTYWRITRVCWTKDGSVERVGRRSN